MNRFLIIGLGNIGEEYRNTRHNIGFDVVTAFVLKNGGMFQPGRLADFSQVSWKGKQFVCIKPTTYMNLSGKAFKYWMDKERMALTNTLTIVDDLALPLEKIRLRGTGTDAGHNGLKDIQATLGTQNYARLRFGIANAFAKGKQVDYVLGKWGEEERKTLQQRINISTEAVKSFVFAGLQQTMNSYNSK